MPYKKGSPEAKAWGEKMKAARAKKDNVEETIDQNDVSALLKRIEELEQKQFFNQPSVPTTKTVVTKFSFNPQDYPDPRDKLFEEPRLKLKGFNKDWWDLGWEIQKVTYEEDGIKLAAPRFLLELYRVIEDEVTGEPSNKKYLRKRANFFEDADAFLAIAEQHGITIPETFHKTFMDEMRYMSLRDWLVDFFYPSRVLNDKHEKVETVIDNRLVPVYEINSDVNNPAPKMPFKD
jgi:hypothetical protein